MKKRIMLAALAAAITFSGCVSVEERPLQSEPVTDVTTTSATTPPVTTTTTEITSEKIILTTTKETQTSIPTENPDDPTVHPDIEEEYNTFILSEADNDFLSRSCFVGDSICSGLFQYDILPSKNVVAQGSTAARNIFDFTFTWNGEELELIPAIVNRQPEYVIFWMGMNDVNITNPDVHADNYEKLLNEVEAYCPDAQLAVVSTTPVLYTSQFTANENIDKFNNAVKEMIEEKEDKNWLYVDVTPELKNSLNSLKRLYDGGDGIHLAPEAYYAVLAQICETIDYKTIDEQRPERPDPEETEDSGENSENDGNDSPELE